MENGDGTSGNGVNDASEAKDCLQEQYSACLISQPQPHPQPQVQAQVQAQVQVQVQPQPYVSNAAPSYQTLASQNSEWPEMAFTEVVHGATMSARSGSSHVELSALLFAGLTPAPPTPCDAIGYGPTQSDHCCFAYNGQDQGPGNLPGPPPLRGCPVGSTQQPAGGRSGSDLSPCLSEGLPPFHGIAGRASPVARQQGHGTGGAPEGDWRDVYEDAWRENGMMG